MKRHVYKIDDGEQHWYSATDAESALRQYAFPLHNSVY